MTTATASAILHRNHRCRRQILLVAVAVAMVLLVRGLLDSNSNEAYTTTATTIKTTIKPNTGEIAKNDVFLATSLPRFLQDYVRVHNHHTRMAGQNNYTTTTDQKYLIWQCAGPREGDGCGGTGDRIKGIVTAFYMAVCSRRVFQIDWTPSQNHNHNKEDELTSFLQPHFIQWQLPPTLLSTNADTIKIIGQYKRMHGYNSLLLKELQVPSDNTNKTIWIVRTNRWYQNEMMDAHWYGGGHLNDTSWLTNQSQCLQKYWKQEDSLPIHADPRYLFRTAFSILFQFSPAVLAARRQMQGDAQLLSSSSSEPALSTASSQSSTRSLPPPAPYIAMHIRTGSKAFHDPGRHTSNHDYQTFYQCAKRLQQGIWERQQEQICNKKKNRQQSLLPIYVASDDAKVKQLVREMEMKEQQEQQLDSNYGSTGGTIRTLPDLLLYHIDKKSKHNSNTNTIMTNNDSYKGALTVWAELKLLMEATCLIMSTSGFSQLASWLQLSQQRSSSLQPPQHCAIHFEDCEDHDKLQQALDAAMAKMEC